MERRKDRRREAVIVDLEGIVPADHLLRKIEMVLIQHLFGIPSLRQTHREIQVNVAYRWFLGYNLLEEIPHFATVSYAFCNRFPAELSEEIFAHLLNKALNHRMPDPSVVFIDGAHIKASANKKKFQKVQVARTAKIYEEQLRKEVAEERRRLGKKDDDGQDGSSGSGSKTVTKTVSATDPDCGLFVKGSHERQFAYDKEQDCFLCPQGQLLRHTTTGKDGKRTYRSKPNICRNCPCRQACGAKENGQRTLTTIWLSSFVWLTAAKFIPCARKRLSGSSPAPRRSMGFVIHIIAA